MASPVLFIREIPASFTDAFLEAYDLFDPSLRQEPRSLPSPFRFLPRGSLVPSPSFSVSGLRNPEGSHPLRRFD